MAKEDLERKVFMICPVREASEEEKLFLQVYMEALEAKGYKVHYPPRDTNQVDPSGGYQICSDNCHAIMNANEVHIYWTKKSKGSLFDIGMTFMRSMVFGQPLVKIINRKDVERFVKEENLPKSFEHVLLQLDNYRECVQTFQTMPNSLKKRCINHLDSILQQQQEH